MEVYFDGTCLPIKLNIVYTKFFRATQLINEQLSCLIYELLRK